MPKLLSSVKKALEVLQTFSEDKPTLSLTEISTRLGTHKSSISRIMATLTAEGFVEKNPGGRGFRLGLKIVDLANRALGGLDLRSHASPYMEALAERVQEMVHLSVLDQNQIVYVEKKGERQGLTVGSKVGGRNPAHASAMGKILLAGLAADELSRVLKSGPLERLTPNTITDLRELIVEIEAVRKNGYAVDNEESFPGIRCVAAPICSRNGRVVAAISATVPVQRMGEKRMKEIRAEVMETARLISERVRMSELGG
ncbi:MAG: IclR family transcriptional regulator [Thermodesulfobacteriota bacterium]